MTIQFLALIFFIGSALFFLVSAIAIWTYICFRTDLLDRFFGRKSAPARVIHRENDCNHSQHSIHDDWSEPEPELVEAKRIERQPKYDVLIPEMKRIEEQSNRVYLPTAKERVSLPVARKMIGAK